jgi:hypothetical protein
MSKIGITCGLLCMVATNGQRYQGILINGFVGGTQLYDPFNSPHARGNLNLGLQTGQSAWLGAAVINGPLAYFATGDGGIHSSVSTAVSCCSVSRKSSSQSVIPLSR